MRSSGVSLPVLQLSSELLVIVICALEYAYVIRIIIPGTYPTVTRLAPEYFSKWLIILLNSKTLRFNQIYCEWEDWLNTTYCLFCPTTPQLSWPMLWDSLSSHDTSPSVIDLLTRGETISLLRESTVTWICQSDLLLWFNLTFIITNRLIDWDEILSRLKSRFLPALSSICFNVILHVALYVNTYITRLLLILVLFLISSPYCHEIRNNLYTQSTI